MKLNIDFSFVIKVTSCKVLLPFPSEPFLSLFFLVFPSLPHAFSRPFVHCGSLMSFTDVPLWVVGKLSTLSAHDGTVKTPPTYTKTLLL